MNKIDKLKKNFVPMLTRGIICINKTGVTIVQRLESDNVKEIIVTEIHPPTRKIFTVELVKSGNLHWYATISCLSSIAQYSLANVLVRSSVPNFKSFSCCHLDNRLLTSSKSDY